MPRLDGWRARAVLGTLVLAIGVCAPLSIGICALVQFNDSMTADACKTVCANTNCPMHGKMKASAAPGAPQAALCLHDSDSGSHGGYLKALHAASTPPPLAFRHEPSFSVQPVLATAFGFRTTFSSTDPPPPRFV
jgi:hypothetical protein